MVILTGFAKFIFYTFLIYIAINMKRLWLAKLGLWIVGKKILAFSTDIT